MFCNICFLACSFSQLKMFWQKIYICIVRNALEKILFLGFIALYCLIESGYSKDQPSQIPNNSSPSILVNNQYFFSPSSNINNQVSDNESSQTVNFSVPVISLKKSFSKQVPSLHAIEKYLFCSYSQYFYHSYYLLIELKKTDITFPFHYFW